MTVNDVMVEHSLLQIAGSGMLNRKVRILN